VPRTFQSTEPRGDGLRIGVVVARFNQAVTDALLTGAIEALTKHGVAEDAIDVAIVPGAFELPLMAQRLEAARGVGEVARRYDLPVTFGVLTTDDVTQALARAGGGHGNKGYDAAVTALEMVHVLREILRF
jgi:6,7-dimethyl-8-ribityllumazine synthase